MGQDREHQLQIFQASLYKEIQKLFSEKNSLVFANRYDELFAITNKLDLNEHLLIQKKLKAKFVNQLLMSIGYGKTPFDANVCAFDGEKNDVVLNNKYKIYGFINETNIHDVTILHFDIEDFTSIKKTQTPYEVTSLIFELYSFMSKFFLTQQSLSFFIGGDNFMVLSNNDYKNRTAKFIDMVNKKFGLILNCGVGKNSTSRNAAQFATESLDMIRKLRNSGKDKPLIYEL